MDIEYNSRCRYDALEISWDGGLHTLCGHLRDGATCSIVAEAASVQLTFRSDSSVNGTGFTLTYSTAEPGAQSACRVGPGLGQNFMNIDGSPSPSPPPVEVSTMHWGQHTSEPCGEVLTTSSGTISSPNHPGHYDNNLDCTWVIDVTQSAVR